MKKLLCALLFSLVLGNASAAPPPLKALLITGGCCHDYAAQKDILKSGLEARLNIVVEQIHTDDKSTRPPFAHHGNPDYAKGFDVVIHDECAAETGDPAVIDAVLKAHLVDGVPAVNLHCAMHSYRSGDFGRPVAAGDANARWFLFLGLQSSAHGPQEPITIAFTDAEHPITRGLAGWTTVNEELYNNVAIHGGHALATGRQREQGRTVESVVAWTHEFGPRKTRVFSTSIGHNNETVADPRYLDMIARAVLWSTDRLKADGTPADGYGRK
jgi:hypothetical protein